MPPVVQSNTQFALSTTDHGEHLADRLQQSLRLTLFSSRAFLRPADLKRLAIDEASAFLAFLADQDPSRAVARGAHLCQLGLGDEAILHMAQALRSACDQYPGNSLFPGTCAQLADAYCDSLLGGFFRAREANILEEQERIRSALQQSLSRYTLQIQTAAEIARATISILDLGELLTTAVDLIRERFALDYVAIYLVDEAQHHAILRAGTGLSGRKRMAAGHRVHTGGPSTVGQCIGNRRHRLVSDITKENQSLESSWLAATQSEIALPLISRDHVIGAITVQSQRSSAFSSQDVPGFQIMADQLANAIENARLYADARQRGDELAIAYEQLKELDRLKDQFMQNISHELRTPLTVISGYAEIMAAGELGPLTSGQEEAMTVMMRSAKALRELVADILAILEVRARKVSPSAVSLTEQVLATLASFQKMATDKGIDVRVEPYPLPLSTLVSAEPEHVRRIVDNLVSNALKFTPDGGQVTLRLAQNDRQVLLEVADNGIGVPQHLQDRIFDRFFQVDGSIRRRFGGTGLGLSLVKELVENYGGQVSVTSPGPDQGSTFSVILPAASDLV